MRYYPAYFTANVAGVSCYPAKEFLLYLLALLNTEIASLITKMLNPTLNSNAGDIEKLPVIIEQREVNHISLLANECVEFAQRDWNAYEASWDFKRHPLV